ncbi:hypothetical protein IQ37_07255 [Chryseobacterium piperi]|uniref:Uncharacterized protein n=1 Tax=Chryseobacterium piperi TaxID=558152 RepID=A0A086BJK2_9FLAO|nr:hypothetical protein [Chryseobacterium piperi]ASW74009.1 hypothetical protein CJF12_06680 [Chryseobacterium piperi]KFF29116.1 hypothetical protein IQ37_07255 [Chryseobacterium piperi]
MLRKIHILFLLGLGFILAQAQETIPFRLTKYNNIIVKALVNHKDSLHLMFQIAMQDASISPERTRKADHITFSSDDISDNNTLQIAQITKTNIRFFNNELTGHEADGKIGTGLFSGKVFKIDYDNNRFVVYDQLPDIKGYQAIPLYPERDQLYINANNIIDNKAQEGHFLLQSGYSGGLLYSNQFAEENELDKRLKITTEKTLKDSSGKSVITKQGILPQLKIGGIIMDQVSAGFFAGDIKTHKVNYFGADTLRRFIWIFSADRTTAYIKPSKYFTAPYYKIN